MAPHHAPSLRSALTVTTAVVVALSLVVSAALIVLTTQLHRTAGRLAAAIEGVRLSEEAEVALLQFGATGDAAVRASLGTELERRLAQIQPYVINAQGVRALERASMDVGAMLAAWRARAPAARIQALETAARVALDSLVALKVSVAGVIEQRAAFWDRLGNLVGFGAGTLLITVAVVLLWWLWSRAFEPVFALAGAMQQFGRGDRRARVRVHGPAELREISIRFNEMAGSLADQHEREAAFLSGVAHDLRTPLTALQLQLGVIRADRPLPPEPRIRRAVETVSRELSRLERMLSDLLDTTNIEAGKLDVRLDECDLRPIVTESLALFEQVSPRHEIRVSVCDGPLPVRCDPHRIEQVVTNLLSNALKYSPEGGPIDVALRPDGDQALIAVTDHGIGIAPEDQARLFEPFRRVGLSQEGIPGVGLGLYVVRRIVEAHDGRIEVESTPGAGSTFRVLLPVTALATT